MSSSSHITTATPSFVRSVPEQSTREEQKRTTTAWNRFPILIKEKDKVERSRQQQLEKNSERQDRFTQKVERIQGSLKLARVLGHKAAIDPDQLKDLHRERESIDQEHETLIKNAKYHPRLPFHVAASSLPPSPPADQKRDPHTKYVFDKTGMEDDLQRARQVFYKKMRQTADKAITVHSQKGNRLNFNPLNPSEEYKIWKAEGKKLSDFKKDVEEGMRTLRDNKKINTRILPF